MISIQSAHLNRTAADCMAHSYLKSRGRGDILTLIPIGTSDLMACHASFAACAPAMPSRLAGTSTRGVPPTAPTLDSGLQWQVQSPQLDILWEGISGKVCVQAGAGERGGEGGNRILGLPVVAR